MRVLAGVLLGLVATATAMYSSSDDVVELTESNFNKLVVQSGDIWFVEFYAPWCGHCQSLAPEWKKAAKALKGIVNIAAVNADEHKSLGGQFGVQGFPTIKIFGAEKSRPQDYNGARTAQGIVDSAMSQVKTLVNARLSGKSSGGGSSGGGGSRGSGGGGGGDAPIELTDSNFEKLVINSDDMWLVEFFAPWCGHCKTLAPHWASAASELSGKVKLGTVDATVETVIASKYGIRGYPTIKYFPAGKKSGEAEDYDGGRTGTDIVQWALDHVSVNIPAPEVLQLTNEEALKNACDDHQLCMVAILPNILDCQSDCRNDYLKVMLQMADKYKKRMWGWLWAEGGSQPAVEESLGIGGFGYPAMAAINARKMKFSLMRGSFSETGINEFLRELAVGRGSTAPLKNSKLPSVDGIEAWDGKDGELPEEEEYDLSDIDLDDLDDIKQEL